MIKHNFFRFCFLLKSFCLKNKISIFFWLTNTSLMLFNKRMEKKEKENEREKERERTGNSYCLYMLAVIVELILLLLLCCGSSPTLFYNVDREIEKRKVCSYVLLKLLSFFLFCGKFFSFLFQHSANKQSSCS